MKVRMMRTDTAMRGRCFQLVVTEGRLLFSESCGQKKGERITFKFKKGEATKC